jgi:hypothetical protein
MCGGWRKNKTLFIKRNMILELQTRLKTLIEADAYFATVEVLTEAKGDITWQISKALAGLGFKVTVATAKGVNPSPDAQRVKMDERLIVTVIENPILNKTGKNAVAGMEELIRIFHGASAGLQAGDKFVVHGHEAGMLDIDSTMLSLQQVEVGVQLVFPRN